MAMPDFTTRHNSKPASISATTPRRWNPRMALFLNGTRNQVHIILTVR
jgi:ribosomal protein S2